MKVWVWGVIVTLAAASFLCFGASAEQAGVDYSTLPEQYVALEACIPETLACILPDGLFSRDTDEVRGAFAQMTSFSGLLGLVLQVYSLQCGQSGGLLASICGLILLCGLMRSVGKAQSLPWASLAPRLCLFGAVSAAGYAAVDSMVAYFTSLRTLMGGIMPLMSALYIMGGNVTRATVGNATLSVGLNVCGSVCASIAPPLFGSCMAMALPGILESGVDLSKISAFLKKTYTTVLGVLTFLLSICLSAQSLLASRADSLAMRSGRYAIGQMIPVVGGALSGSLDTLAAGVGMLRGLAGGCGVILLFLTCLPVLLQMLALRTLLDLGAMLAHLLGCAPESAVLSEASSLFGYMAAAVAMCTAVFIIAVG
ncbi:MAG: hypothetical protein J6V39_08270, partial [Clostridia bacterium]|nr:hypothetical protein [Clostridia bacterium]